ncbi:MAG: FmdB family zinc ribbon protein [Halanaerobiaceae bacterium]
MPNYKYKCRDCKNTFTVKSSIKKKDKGLDLSCPECEGKDVFQLFDSIGVVGGSSSNGSGASCSGISCSSCSSC